MFDVSKTKAQAIASMIHNGLESCISYKWAAVAAATAVVSTENEIVYHRQALIDSSRRSHHRIELIDTIEHSKYNAERFPNNIAERPSVRRCRSALNFWNRDSWKSNIFGACFALALASLLQCGRGWQGSFDCKMSDTSSASAEHQAAPGLQATSQRSSSSSSADSKQDATASADVDKALEYLSMQIADTAEAKHALEATACPELTDPVKWAEAAAMWLACNYEVDIEAKAMGAAMQQSLVEAETEKQKEKPVHELSEEQLKLRYEHCIILQELQQQADAVLPSLWEHHLKFLRPLLEEGLKAYKWYPRHGTRLYLQKLGQDCASMLCHPAVLASASVQCTLPGSNGHMQSPIKHDAAAVLSEQLKKLQNVLYAMPETSGAVPIAFTEIEEAQDVDGIDEVLERPRKRLCGSECVDLL